MTRSERATCLVAAAAVLTAAYGGYRFRREYIRAFFLDGAGDAEPPRLTTPRSAPDPAGLPPVARTRVVVLDGVGLETARSLPHLRAVCERGHDLQVDVGFPTVSLPVQHVLWTGLTQSQSGVLFRGKPQILGRPRPPPAHGVPAQVPGSVAIAESHAYIVGALGFAAVQPAHPTELPPGWDPDADDGGFMTAARAAIASDAALVEVHVLRVDVAGHLHGSDSPQYREAAAGADRILGALWVADATRPGGERDDTRWFVLADHGHRGAGGHGGAEQRIRVVRACIVGALPAAITAGTRVHLVDVARAIADSVGVRLSDASAGRPLYAAAAAPPSAGATLPRPGASRWLAAALALALAMALTGWAMSRGSAAWRAPWWWCVALLCVVAFESAPTLSVPMVYAPRGKAVYMAALPGLLILAVQCGVAMRARAPSAAVGLLALPVGTAIGALLLAGGADGLLAGLGAASEPPLMPAWTAYGSVLLILGFAGAVVIGLGLAVSALSAASVASAQTERLSRDRTRRPSTGRGPGVHRSR